MSAAAKNLQRICQVVEDHNKTCEFPATALVMNPFEVERLGWDDVMGLPIYGDPQMGTGQFRVVCDKDTLENTQIAEEVVDARSTTPIAVPAA